VFDIDIDVDLNIIEPLNPEMPVPPPGCTWTPVIDPLRSAYFEFSREDDEGNPTDPKVRCFLPNKYFSHYTNLMTNVLNASKCYILQEPDFTNYAHTYGETFVDVLDYIFFSGEWTVVDVLPLPHRDDMSGTNEFQ
jgi:hypothetical protein